MSDISGIAESIVCPGIRDPEIAICRNSCTICEAFSGQIKWEPSRFAGMPVLFAPA